MTREEFAQLHDYLVDRFGIGRMDAWAQTGTIYADFEALDTDTVWKALLTRLDTDTRAEFPPTPTALRALTLERIRHTTPAPPALPKPKTTWAEVSQRLYGEVISPREAVERKARELAERRS